MRLTPKLCLEGDALRSGGQHLIPDIVVTHPGDADQGDDPVVCLGEVGGFERDLPISVVDPGHTVQYVESCRVRDPVVGSKNSCGGPIVIS